MKLLKIIEKDAGKLSQKWEDLHCLNLASKKLQNISKNTMNISKGKKKVYDSIHHSYQ